MWARTWMTATALAVGIVMTGPAIAGAGSGPAADDNGRDPRTITVTASGLVRGTPDVLDLTVGVTTRAKTAAEALSRNTSLANKVIDVLKDAGVEDDDLQTSYFSIAPFYDEDGEDLEGYSVSNLVTASLRDFEKAGEVIDAATEIAGNEIVVQGISFSFDDNTELVAKARADAVKRGRSQAEQLADAAGVELGNLLSINEDYAPYGPVGELDTGRFASTEAAAAPIEPGSQTLDVQVTMVYEIN